jgi:hypothetical protein
MKGDDPYQFTRNTSKSSCVAGVPSASTGGLGSYTWAWIEAGSQLRAKELGDIGYDEYKDAIDRPGTTPSRRVQDQEQASVSDSFLTPGLVGGPSRGIYWSQFMAYTGGILAATASTS